MLDKPSLRVVGFGMIGGLAGTALMDAVMVLTFLLAGQPATAFFTMVGDRLGDGALAGVVAHNLVGLTGGLVVALLVLNIKALRIGSVRRGLAVGVAAGALTIPLGCVPLAIWLGQPILEVVAFSVLPHLVWGTVVGWVVSFAIISRIDHDDVLLDREA